MKDHFRTMRSMVKEKRHLVMARFMKGNTNKAKELEKEYLTGAMVYTTRDNSKTTLSKEQENATGQEVRLMKVNGRMVNSMEKESRYLEVGIDTKDSTKRIKSTALVS